MKFWNVVKNEETGAPEIRIEGPIQMEESLWAWIFGEEEQTAKGIREEIRKMDGQDITVWINSNGGECIAASVIYTALREHKGKVTVKVDGSAISAASVIAMAGDENSDVTHVRYDDSQSADLRGGRSKGHGESDQSPYGGQGDDRQCLCSQNWKAA